MSNAKAPAGNTGGGFAVFPDQAAKPPSMVRLAPVT